MDILLLLIGVIIGAGIVWFTSRKIYADKQQRIDELSQKTATLQDDLNASQIECTELRIKLSNEKDNAEKQFETLKQAEQKLVDTFKALSADALKNNNKSFVNLAKSELEKFQSIAKNDLDKRETAINNLVKPLKESLDKYDVKIHEIEEKRTKAYSSLDTHLKSLEETQKFLRSETANLVKALRTPAIRGNWGEIQLKKVVELAGMVEYCDFKTQQTVSDEHRTLRPDMVVKLPNNKHIVVDSKAPLEAYLDALEAKDDQSRITYFKRHARHIRDHLKKLGEKSYWEQFDQTPEFVVMFLPGECFFSAALEQDPSLIEYGIREYQVILATPTTLIALLKAVSYGWRQEQVAKNALEISRLGKDLYKRIQTFASNFARMQRSLDSTVKNYNKAVGSLERSVFPGVRKFKELGASSNIEVATPKLIENIPREINAPDMPDERDSSSDEFIEE